MKRAHIAQELPGLKIEDTRHPIFGALGEMGNKVVGVELRNFFELAHFYEISQCEGSDFGSSCFCFCLKHFFGLLPFLDHFRASDYGGKFFRSFIAVYVRKHLLKPKYYNSSFMIDRAIIPPLPENMVHRSRWNQLPPSMSSSIFPNSFEGCPISRNIDSLSIFLASLEQAFKYCAITILTHAMTLNDSIFKHAFIDISIGSCHFAFLGYFPRLKNSNIFDFASLIKSPASFFNAFLELAFISASISPCLLPNSLWDVISPISFICITLVLVVKFPMAYCYASLDISFIISSIRVDESAFDIGAALDEKAFVDRSIWEIHNPFSVGHQIIPLTMVNCSILIDYFRGTSSALGSIERLRSEAPQFSTRLLHLKR